MIPAIQFLGVSGGPSNLAVLAAHVLLPGAKMCFANLLSNPVHFAGMNEGWSMSANAAFINSLRQPLDLPALVLKPAYL